MPIRVTDGLAGIYVPRMERPKAFIYTNFTKKGAFYAIKIKFISLCDIL